MFTSVSPKVFNPGTKVDTKPLQSGSGTTAAKGYFAFPPGQSLTPEARLRTFWKNEEPIPPQHESSNVSDSNERLDSAWRERERVEVERRKAREVLELEEALKGEKDWVRSGGVLRDAEGRRDYARTAEVRKLVEIEEAQRKALERWAAYEGSWTKLNLSTELLSFGDFPWPLVNKPTDPMQLRNKDAVAHFLFETLPIPGVKSSRKDRLRTSLLRWHPDKLGALLSRVKEEDGQAVKDAVDAVVITLMELQDQEKSERP